MSATPFGAQPLDTGEFMLGEVAVTVVFFESDGTIDPSTEDWNEPHRLEVKQAIEEGLAWWEETLALYTDVHTLDFIIDYQYADHPIPVGVEPISRTAQEFPTWVGTFLDFVGAERTGQIDNDVRLFNHQKRIQYETNWAFTIFVLNSEADMAASGEGLFPGSIQGAFSVAGGAFIATPSTRPASTIAHEAAHQFWAMDEYTTNPNYESRRGYYNTQNINSPHGNPNPDSIVLSLMGTQSALREAYLQHTSSPSSFESIGWKDSDGDGIFDVLDVPLELNASAAFDPLSQSFRLTGSGKVGVLPNQNSAGLQNSMTINRLGGLEYRLDGGAWQLATNFDGYETEFDVSFLLPDAEPHVLEFRLVDQSGYVFSEVFSASTEAIDTTPVHGFSGAVIHDVSRDTAYAPGERGLAGWTITVTDMAGIPVTSQTIIDPDTAGHAHVFEDEFPGIRLRAIGSDVDPHFPDVSARHSPHASTGSLAFFSYANGTWQDQWSATRQLRIEFDTPVSRVSLDAIADSVGDVAHLELYDASGQLLGRYTTSPLKAGEVETMVVELPVPQAAYAIARGHTNHSVALDNLHLGRSHLAYTDALGAFAIPFDLPGEFQLVATPGTHDAGKFDMPLPVPVTLADGQGTARAILAATTATGVWSNRAVRGDINDDGVADEADLSLLLDELASPAFTETSERFPRTFLETHEQGQPYFDVNGDGILSTLDLLTSVNLLRAEAVPSGTEPEGPIFVIVTTGEVTDQLDTPLVVSLPSNADSLFDMGDPIATPIAYLAGEEIASISSGTFRLAVPPSAVYEFDAAAATLETPAPAGGSISGKQESLIAALSSSMTSGHGSSAVGHLPRDHFFASLADDEDPFFSELD